MPRRDGLARLLLFALKEAVAATSLEPAPVRPYVHPSQYTSPQGERTYSDGMHAGYEPRWATLAIARLTLLAYVGVPNLLLALLLGAAFSRTAALLAAALFGTLLLPATPLRVGRVLDSYVFLCWRRYFRFSFLFEHNLNAYQDYIIAQFPHGAFPLGALVGGTFMASAYPEYPCYALAANAAFLVPVWRHVHAWLGTCAATKANFHALLGRGVRGPLPPSRHRHHHGHTHRHVGTPTAAAGAVAGAHEQAAGVGISSAGRDPAAASEGGGRPSPFAGAHAAAALAAASAKPKPQQRRQQQQQQQHGPDAAERTREGAPSAGLSVAASAAVASVARIRVGGSGSIAEAPRRTFSAPLGDVGRSSSSSSGGSWRMPARLAWRAAAMLHAGRTLSESGSSDSEGDDGDAATCCCGSGLPCNGGGCRAASNQRSSDGGGSSTSSSGSDCSCCGAYIVHAELTGVTSLGVQDSKALADGGLGSLKLSRPLPSILSSRGSSDARGSGAGLDDDASVPAPLPAPQQQQQHGGASVLRWRGGSAAAAAAPAGEQQHRWKRARAPGSSSSSSISECGPQPDHEPVPPGTAAPCTLDPATGARRLGVSVGLMVGGIAEMFCIAPDHERIKLAGRKGFVRIAVQHGVPILPVYTFGVNQVLDFGPAWLAAVSRRARASLGLILGVGGLPLPRRLPLFQVTGAPLDVGPPLSKDDPGFGARVDAVHAAFCAEISRLYYTHRGAYGHGFENRPLVIC